MALIPKGGKVTGYRGIEGRLRPSGGGNINKRLQLFGIYHPKIKLWKALRTTQLQLSLSHTTSQSSHPIHSWRTFWPNSAQKASFPSSKNRKIFLYQKTFCPAHLLYWATLSSYNRSASISNGSFAFRMTFPPQKPREEHQILQGHSNPRKVCLSRKYYGY